MNYQRVYQMIYLRIYYLQEWVQYNDEEGNIVIPEEARDEKEQDGAACREADT